MYLYTYMYMCEVDRGRMYIWYMYNILIDFLVEYFFCVRRVVKLNVETVCTCI